MNHFVATPETISAELDWRYGQRHSTGVGRSSHEITADVRCLARRALRAGWAGIVTHGLLTPLDGGAVAPSRRDG